MKALTQIQAEHSLEDAALEFEHSRYNVDLLDHYRKHGIIDRYTVNHQRFGPFPLSESGRKRLIELTLPLAMDRLERALETLSRTRVRVKQSLKPDAMVAIELKAERYYAVQRHKRGLTE